MPAIPIVRNATANDYPRIVELLTAAKLPLDGLHGADGFLVLHGQDELVGCAAVERYGQVGLLRSVAIVASERNRGLGRLLVQEVLRRARQEGLSELVLLTKTAEKFFAGIGFQKIPRDQVPLAAQASIEFTTACCSSAAVMRLAL